MTTVFLVCSLVFLAGSLIVTYLEFDLERKRVAAEEEYAAMLRRW